MRFKGFCLLLLVTETPTFRADQYMRPRLSEYFLNDSNYEFPCLDRVYTMPPQSYHRSLFR